MLCWTETVRDRQEIYGRERGKKWPELESNPGRCMWASGRMVRALPSELLESPKLGFLGEKKQTDPLIGWILQNRLCG